MYYFWQGNSRIYILDRFYHMILYYINVLPYAYIYWVDLYSRYRTKNRPWKNSQPRRNIPEFSSFYRLSDSFPKSNKFWLIYITVPTPILLQKIISKKCNEMERFLFFVIFSPYGKNWPYYLLYTIYQLYTISTIHILK